ncbi:GntR family transcriptional regulator [Stappia sp.]|uniref:GntR family transcriptional regulator n=1 Tax=Stappia sp. TaxID=1870903 RepID=UPI003A990256
MGSIEKLRRLASTAYLSRSDRPIWLQIYDRLEVALENGTLAEGEKLPGEDDLATLFGVSRITLRRALDRHQREGRLQARKGVGIFVRAPTIRYIVHRHEAFNEAVCDDAADLRILSLVRKPASPAAIRAFSLAEGEDVFEMRNAIVIGATTAYLATKEFRIDVFADMEAVVARGGSILDAYAAAGIPRYVRAETRIFADFATEAEAGDLQVSVGAPLLRSRSYNTDPEGRVIEVNAGCWPMFAVELVFASGPADIARDGVLDPAPRRP